MSESNILVQEQQLALDLLQSVSLCVSQAGKPRVVSQDGDDTATGEDQIESLEDLVEELKNQIYLLSSLVQSSAEKLSLLEHELAEQKKHNDALQEDIQTRGQEIGSLSKMASQRMVTDQSMSNASLSLATSLGSFNLEKSDDRAALSQAASAANQDEYRRIEARLHGVKSELLRSTFQRGLELKALQASNESL